MCLAGTGFISIAEAASWLETTETRVLVLLKQQQLAGKQVKDAWYVDKASMQLCGEIKMSGLNKTCCGRGCARKLLH